MSLHECAAGRACRDPVIDCESRRREPALIEEAYGLCKACKRAVRQAIRDMPLDYYALGSAERMTKGQVSVRLTPEPAIPINATALALAFELGEWAEAAMLLVCDKLNVKPKLRQKLRGYPVNNHAVIEQASRVLTHDLDLLLDATAKPVRVWQSNGTDWGVRELDGITVALKIQRAHSKVKGVLGEGNPRRRLTMPCPVIDCGMPTLGIANGETDVTCTSCGGRWTDSEIDWLMGMLIGSVNEKEIQVLLWLLAEKTYQLGEVGKGLAEATERLARIDKLASLGDDALCDVSATVFAILVKEILDG